MLCAWEDEEIAYLQLEKKVYTVFEGEGCSECRGTGYKGRTGIFEVLDLTDNVKRVLSDQVDLTALYGAARSDGMVNLRQVAVKKRTKLFQLPTKKAVT